jgi:sulfatase modifying factor 1
MSVVEHGIPFRYIPAGSFLMGNETGEPDERPMHAVELSHYWLSETPISWSTYCDLMDWEPPPHSTPKHDGSHLQGEGQITGDAGFSLHEENKIRMQYCEDATTGAGDWHAHMPGGGLSSLFRAPPREDPRRPWRYDRKPMVSVSWLEAEDLCANISGAGIQYRLPTEAEWEKAARGGLLGSTYPWGSQLPSKELCDYDSFDRFSILPMRRFPPNNYGLYALSGCVWEWTADWYDSGYYSESPRANPSGPSEGKEKALRGGSWADSAEVVTVSFRMSRQAQSWKQSGWGGHFSPNVGFRICRAESATA